MLDILLPKVPIFATKYPKEFQTDLPSPFARFGNTTDLGLMVNTPMPSIIFTGRDAREAEDFIEAIRKLAFREERLHDNVWMANMASAFVRRRAMRWHAGLEAAVQRDWNLLTTAILNEWPFEEVDDLQAVESESMFVVLISSPLSPLISYVPSIPTPAAAPSPVKLCFPQEGHYTGRIIIRPHTRLEEEFLFLPIRDFNYMQPISSPFASSATRFRLIHLAGTPSWIVPFVTLNLLGPVAMRR